MKLIALGTTKLQADRYTVELDCFGRKSGRNGFIPHRASDHDLRHLVRGYIKPGERRDWEGQLMSCKPKLGQRTQQIRTRASELGQHPTKAAGQHRHLLGNRPVP